MNCEGGTSTPSWDKNEPIGHRFPESPIQEMSSGSAKSEILKSVKEENGVATQSIVNVTESARMGLEVMMRKKKQRIVSGGGGGGCSGGAAGGFSGDSDSCPRPMSWEWEMSDEDYLSKGMEEMSPSPIAGRIASFDPGSPMSTNDSDREDAAAMQPFTRKVLECSLKKPFGPSNIPGASPNQQQQQQQQSVVQGNRGLFHVVVPPSSSDKTMPPNSHHSNGPQPPFFSPSQSPLQQRHLNSQSYSSSSSPEQIKRLFYSPTQSPLQSRHVPNLEPPYSQSPSPSQQRHVSHPKDATFSPTQSPLQSRHVTGRESPFGSSYSSVGSPSGSVRYSPNQSPVQERHCGGHAGSAFGSGTSDVQLNLFGSQRLLTSDVCEDDKAGLNAEVAQHNALAGQTGISRQQLINSPCPICGDRISGFHYGIFSCESCKGFFKRTVQNKKNYVCLRGATCPITTTTRKKCPACRFDKCLKRGMKLEAIREDRTRGGRSTYQCTFALPPSLAACSEGLLLNNIERIKGGGGGDKSGDESDVAINGSGAESTSSKAGSHCSGPEFVVPTLIQEIMSVEHLWYYSEGEMQKMPEASSSSSSSSSQAKSSEAACNADFFHSLCSIADLRLFKIVKWCKSLPLFRNVSIDDQICLLLNSWCQLLLLSCCFRSINTPEEIRVSLGKSVSLQQARTLGLGPIIERMLNLTDHLRRLRVDQYEYVCLKVIILLSSDSDVGSLKEPEKVHHAQERVIQALQTYTMSRYIDHPSKFGELLLRIPELERTCQIGKDSLSMKHREGEVQSFNLLVELLRGEH